MNNQKITILAVAVLLLLTGCEDNNQEYHDMPRSLIERMLKEWESEIKKGKLISIDSRNVINNKMKHK